MLRRERILSRQRDALSRSLRHHLVAIGAAFSGRPIILVAYFPPAALLRLLMAVLTMSRVRNR
jgi:hypothetical protein